MKACTVCYLTKPLNSYHLHPNSKNGRNAKCIACVKKCRSAYERTKDGLAQRMYTSQKDCTEKRGYSHVAYTIEEFKQWLFQQPNFTILYENWVLSTYISQSRPSIDRLNDYLPYTFENIRLTTWDVNRTKCREDARNAINTKASVAVDQLDLDGNFLRRFHSTAEATRFINKPKGSSDIRKACDGKLLTAYKYRWRLSYVPNSLAEITTHS